MTSDLQADLVCEGGGVKGIGLVGAVHELAAAGYTFPRVAGTSSGAIVSCFIAALQEAGEPLSRLDDIAATINYSKFEDSSWLGRLPLVGGALSLLTADGIYEGDCLEKFIAGALKDLGVETFGDLRTGDSLPAHAWSLVVTASDLSRRRLVRIPWDLPAYDVDPDEFSVAKAVRASAAMFTSQDAAYTDDICTVKRTVFVPTDEVSAVDFSIDQERADLLYANGAQAAKNFLAGWNFEDYKTSCRIPA